jgi:hypothetical protein
LSAELEAAQSERAARQKWLSRFKRIAAALAAIVVGVISIALVLVTTAMNREAEQRQHAEEQTVIANEQRQEAESQTKIADGERQKAVQQTVIATEQRQEAENQTKIANSERENAKAAEREAETQRDKAEEARKIAEVKEAEAVLARQGEERAAYTARIGMAAAKIEENAYDTAAALLAACQPAALRDWEWGYLKRLSAQGVDLPAQGAVRAVAFSPSGNSFVTAGDDGQAHAWERATGKPLWNIDSQLPIHAVALSADGKLVATAGDDGVIRLANAADGTAIAELKGHTGRVLGVNFSLDSQWLVSAASDNTARVWDLSTRRETAGSPLRGHYGWVWSATFAPSGKQLVTTGEDGRAIVWTFDATQDRADLRLAPSKVFLGHQGPVFAAAISPNGRQIATGGYDKRVLVWQPELIADVDLRTLVATSQPLTPQPSSALEGHTGPVRTVRFSPDGAYVITAGDDNTVRVWDSLTGRPHAQLRGHSRPVQACSIAADGRQLLSGGQEGEIKLWDLVDYKPAPQGLALAGHADSVLAAAFSRDGSRVITAGGDHAARVFDAANGQCSATLSEGHDFLASRALYFDGGRRLITAGGDRTVRIWDAANGTQLDTLEQTGRNATVAISADGRWVLSGNTEDDGDKQAAEIESRPQLALWQLDADRSQATRQLMADASFGTGHPALVTAIAVSPDGQHLFSGDEAGGGRIWNTATGSLTHRLKGHTAKITGAAFLPDGRRLLTSSHDGTVAQWDVATGQELPGMLVHGDAEHRDAFDIPVVGFAMAPDGRQVVTLSEETVAGALQSVIRSWNLAQGTPLGELYRGTDALSSVAYTADGRAILAAGTVTQAGGSEGGLVRRFDLATGREVTAAGGQPFLDLTDRPEGIWSAVEAPGGDGILTVGGNGAALWTSAGAGQAEMVFKPHSGVTATGFSTSGKFAVTGSTDRRVKIWNVATGLAAMQLPTEHTAAISSAQFSPSNEDLLLTAGEEGVAHLWDWPSRKVLHTLAHHAQGSSGLTPLAAVFSPDGKQVLTAGADAKLQIWNAADGASLAVWQAGAPIQAVAYSSDGKRILAGLASGQAVIYDAATRTPLVQYAGHTDAVSAVAFSPEGRRILTGSRDRLLKVWDAGSDGASATQNSVGPASGKELLTLRYHEQAITSVAFAPDGRSILSASLDGTAIVWPTAAWQGP